MWYIYTMDYYSATKKNELVLFLETWVELKIIAKLNKISEAQKDRNHVFTHTQNLDLMITICHGCKRGTVGEGVVRGKGERRG
jgi:hypothetical protein